MAGRERTGTAGGSTLIAKKKARPSGRASPLFIQQILPRMDYIRKVIKPIAAGSLLLPRRRPAQTEGVRAAIVLALDGELFAALIEAEHLIVQVQQRNNRLQSA